MVSSSNPKHPIGSAAMQPGASEGSSASLQAIKPLHGFKVIELHAIGPVPFAGYILGQLGAQVIRVSPPADPQLGVGVSERFDLLNSNKSAQALDLKRSEGLAALEVLLADADLLLEGFRPGVLERLGLNPEALLARHPRLVIGRLSGWGERGVWADRAGHDINYLAVAGILHAIGPAQTPVVPLNVVGDFGGGTMHLLLGVLCALLRRSQSGQGMVVSTSILAASVGLTPMFYGLIAAGIWDLKRENNLLDGAAPFYRVYRCQDERFVAVGAIEAKFYRELLRLTGLEGQIDPSQQHDRQSWPATIEAFGEVFARKTRDEWACLAEQTDACLAPVLDFIEASQYAHNLDNGLYERSAEHAFVRPGQVLSFGCL
jgi:alpha-methylacyl-CoA racemase